MSIELATKTCSKCGETKSLTEYYRHASNTDGLFGSCKACVATQTKARRERRRAEMGEKAWLEHQREAVKRHRTRTGNETGKAYERAKRAALEALRRRHSDEFEHLFLLARRGELEAATGHVPS